MQTRSRTKVAAAVMTGLAGAACAAAIGRLARFEVVESSMEPALRPGDFLITATGRTFRRGDIVVYPDPTASTRSLVKRVVGLPGERITISGGRVAVDGSELSEPWAAGPTRPDGEWVNPPGTCFTLGDNRALSSGDSRATGPIRLDEVNRVVWRYWPFASFGRL